MNYYELLKPTLYFCMQTYIHTHVWYGMVLYVCMYLRDLYHNVLAATGFWLQTPTLETLLKSGSYIFMHRFARRLAHT